MKTAKIEGLNQEKIDIFEKETVVLDAKKMKSVIANDLARQGSQLSIEEEKIAHIIFSSLNPFGSNPPVVKLSKSDLFELLGYGSQKDRYKRLKARMKSLVTKSWVDVHIDGWDHMGFLMTDVVTSHKSNDVFVHMNPKFLPFVEQLKGNYTSLKLDAVVSFKSKFSLALYKLLSSFTDGSTGHTVMHISTKELKDVFGLSKDDYVSNGKFARFIFEEKTIVPAVEEINEKVRGFGVNWKKIKKGGRVIYYQFEWIDQFRLPSVEPDVPEGQMTIDEFV